MLAGERLHLGEDVAAVLGKTAAALAGTSLLYLRDIQFGHAKDVRDALVELSAQGGRQNGNLFGGEFLVHRQILEEFVEVRPHVIQACLHAALGFLGAQAKAEGPLIGVVDVVLDFLDAFAAMAARVSSLDASRAV